MRLVTGCSWDVAGRFSKAGETTLRNRRTEWIKAGVFDGLVDHAITAYDRIIGLDLSEVAVDGSVHKAPAGGQDTGPNPTDRGKCGWKWSVATDQQGIPIGWSTAGANRHDSKLFASTMEQVNHRGLVPDIETLHLDRGYDYHAVRDLCAELGLTDTVIGKRRLGAVARPKQPVLGLRWPVERTNSWLSNFGQLRRNTDRFTEQRLAQLALAVTLIIAIKLVKWAKRWNT